MKHCPLKGSSCDYENCAWYDKGTSGALDECAILRIGRMITYLRNEGIYTQEKA